MLRLLPAATRRPRSGFTLRDLLAATACLTMALAIGIPGCYQATTTNRGRGCLNNLRWLAVGIQNYESAQRRYPLVSDAAGPLHQIPPGTLGSDKSDSSGYGWMVSLLPYMEEEILYREIKTESDEFQQRPFDPELAFDYGGGHFATIQTSYYRCPSYSGDNLVYLTGGSEYDNLMLESDPPALANYVAIVGTHASADGTIDENGAIVSACETDEDGCNGRGLRLKDLNDGISQTVILTETIEPTYAAWVDGQATWVVGVPAGSVMPKAGDGMPGATQTLIGEGAPPYDPQLAYSTVGLLDGRAWPGAEPRHWGASSEHSGGVVIHAFADGHVLAVHPDCDPTVYYRFITRAGGEPVKLEDL